MFAFELSRQLQITPLRLAYAREQEEALFRSLLTAARLREDLIRHLIATTLDQDREQILQRAEAVVIRGAGSRLGSNHC